MRYFMPGRAIQQLLIACILMISCAHSAFADVDGATSPADSIVQDLRPEREPPIGSSVDLNKAYLMGYGTDFKNIVTSPARWETSDWITATLVAGIGVGLYDNDTKIQKWVSDHKTSATNKIGDDITLVGHGVLTIPVVGGLYLYGQVAGDGKATETALLSVESFILTGVFVQVLKRTCGRHRPYTGDPYNTWDGPSLSSSKDSFPSGHASSAFAVATVIAEEYDNYIVPPLAYTVATITALNRVSHNAHWSSDIFIGSAIGYFTGKAIVASHAGGKQSRVSVAPMIDDAGGLGMVVTYKF